MSDAGSVSALMDDHALRLEDTSDREQDMSSPRESIDTSHAKLLLSQLFSKVTSIKERRPEEGQTWYLLPSTWYNRWFMACSNLSIDQTGVMDNHSDEQSLNSLVGPVDCSDLFSGPREGEEPDLVYGLQEGRDFEMVPEAAWQLLTRCYGQRGPAIPRKVISVQGSPPIVEVYPPKIAFALVVGASMSTDHDVAPVESLSRCTILKDIRRKAMRVLRIMGLSEGQVRLWLFPAQLPLKSQVTASELGKDSKYTLMSDEALKNPLSSVLDRSPNIPMPFAVEAATSDGTWPSATVNVKQIFAQTNGHDSFSRLQAQATTSTVSSDISTTNSTGTSGSPEPSRAIISSQTANDRGSGRPRGLKGLVNLGNTCFLNSALQCLSNTPELTEYFVSRVFEQEINEENPLGNGGALARAFGGLIQQLWSGQGSNAFAPRDFKWSLARFAPQFSGYAQQDTQELLAFLLDGLHEDLNRIKKKPYIEAPEWRGGDLEEMVRFAKKQWDIYKMRNDSVIVDLFQGQYRSTLVCPECGKVSIKFDPFMYLTLPLPNKSTWKHAVIFVPYDSSEPIKSVNLMLSGESSISRIKQELAGMFGVSGPSKIIGGELYQRRFHRLYFDYEPVNSIEAADHAVFWELPHEVSLPLANNNERLYYLSSSLARHPQVEEERFEHLIDNLRSEDHIVLPVFSVTARGSFGMPFFVGLSRAQAADPTQITSVIVQQYMRFSSHPQQLSAAAQSVIQAAARFRGDVPTVDVAEWHSEVSPSSGAGDVTAEILPDGYVVEVQEPSPPSAAFSEDSVVHVIDGMETAIRKAPQPFEVHFVVNFTKPIKDVDNWQGRDEQLLDRSRRLQAKEAVDGSERTFPLVYKGGGLVCLWDETEARDLLPVGGIDGKWGERIDTVDDRRVIAEKMEAASSPGKCDAKKELNLEDCLDEFTQEEQLGAEDPWFCPDCKEFRQATKKFDLWKVPDILVVHLKRFSVGRGLRDKLDVNVDFPIDGLDLTDRVKGTKAVKALGLHTDGGVFNHTPPVAAAGAAAKAIAMTTEHGSGADSPTLMTAQETEDLSTSILSAISEANDNAVASDRPIYDLFAVDNHFGGLGGGHYTACAKNSEDGRWYYFDDSHVRPLGGINEVKGRAAYVLFYRRRTARAIGGKSREIIRMASATPSAASSRAEPTGFLNGEVPAKSVSSIKATLGGLTGARDPYRHPFRSSQLVGSPDSMGRDISDASNDETELHQTFTGGQANMSSSPGSSSHSQLSLSNPGSSDFSLPAGPPPEYYYQEKLTADPDSTTRWVGDVRLTNVYPIHREDDDYEGDIGQGESLRSDQPEPEEPRGSSDGKRKVGYEDGR